MYPTLPPPAYGERPPAYNPAAFPSPPTKSWDDTSPPAYGERPPAYNPNYTSNTPQTYQPYVPIPETPQKPKETLCTAIQIFKVALNGIWNLKKWAKKRAGQLIPTPHTKKTVSSNRKRQNLGRSRKVDSKPAHPKADARSVKAANKALSSISETPKTGHLFNKKIKDIQINFSFVDNKIQALQRRVNTLSSEQIQLDSSYRQLEKQSSSDLSTQEMKKIIWKDIQDLNKYVQKIITGLNTSCETPLRESLLNKEVRAHQNRFSYINSKTQSLQHRFKQLSSELVRLDKSYRQLEKQSSSDPSIQKMKNLVWKDFEDLHKKIRRIEKGLNSTIVR